MKKIFSSLVIVLATTLASHAVFAFQPKETAAYFNGPTVSSVTSSEATFSLSPSVLAGMNDEEKSRIYFEYIEKDLVCIMIYPTPESCLPKKTPVGKTSVTVSNLKPGTAYTVLYKADNSIRCITTPCPENSFESLTTEFKTRNKETQTPILITKNLFVGTRGTQVVALQNMLIQKGYMDGPATGYFGFITMRAVANFQRDNNVPATGFVGPLTRKAITSPSAVTEEKFEGTVTAYSTQCFVNGECSITVDGKKIVTTLGWTQGPVGTVTGIPDFGSVEGKVGSKAEVYAKKTATGYTLYGNSNYYIKIK